MKRFTLVLVGVFAFSLMGCSVKGLREMVTSSSVFTNARTKLLDALVAEETETNRALADKIIGAINAKDSEALKGLFCGKSREGLAGLDTQIRAIMTYYDQGVREFEVANMGENSSVEYGEITELSRLFKIVVSQSPGRVSTLTVAYNKIYGKDPSREGLVRLNVYERDGDAASLYVGYEWQDYYKDASALSYQVIQLYEGGDYGALLGLFRPGLRDNADVRRKLKSSMGFISGRPLYGKTKDGTYDGNLDFHTESMEDEIVENGSPIEVRLSAKVTNIITDQRTVYSIDLFATKRQGDGVFFIDSMVLRDGESNEIIIQE
jgi:Domain of unknown function (DUF5104)